ncbi:hypothetical protein K1719_016588 [Acacia pycnantha]|nr:hypothetical protein K1719_016588 [Acacia pycnantha]
MPSSTMKQVEMEFDIPLWIPPEVLSNIFKRLPVRTLIQLQSVCKDWRNRLYDPSFIQEHLQYTPHENPSLLFHLFHCLRVHDTWELYTIDVEMQILPVESVPLIEFLRVDRVIGSINGLVCVKSNYDFLKILVWNPAIRKFRPLTRRANFWVKMGFGFCSIVKDYKVVIISYHPGHGCAGLIHQVEVYSLSTYSWKKVEFGELLDGVEISSDGFGTNGAIFWSGFKGNGHFLISYCIATEEFALITPPFPPPVFPDPTAYRLSVYENKLALLSHTTTKNYEYTLIDLWVMGERWSWTKKYSIKHPYYLLPRAVWRNMIVCKYDETLRGRNAAPVHDVLNIVLVNLTTDELERFVFQRVHADFDAFNYVESLVPVD